MFGIGRKATGKVFLLILVVTAAINLSLPALAEEAQVAVRKVDISRYPTTSLSLTLSGSEKLQAQVLGADNFVLRENGERVRKFTVQPIAQNPEPVAVVLAVDSSGSMVGKPLSDAKDAARAFIDQMRFQDKIAVVAFDVKPRVLSALTSDKAVLIAAIDGIKAQGETALYDGLLASLDQLAASGISHRNVIVLSDGGDTVSTAPENSVVEKAAALRTPIFGVALESREYKPGVLQSICNRSGGGLLIAPNSGALTALYLGLAKVLHNQYKITYASLQDRTKKRIYIQLELEAADIRARSSVSAANPAYIAPKAKPILARPQELAPALSSSAIFVLAVSLGFVAVFLFVLVLSSIVFYPPPDYRKQLKFYDLAWGKSYSRKEQKESSILTQMTDRVMTGINYVASKRKLREFLHLKLEQANLPLQPNEFILFHFAFVIVVGAAATSLSSSVLGVVSAVLFSAIIPVLVLQFLIERRRNKFHDQLPDTLTTIAGSIRAGYSFLQAVSSVAEEAAPPMSEEFRKVVGEARLGLPLETALEKMADRVCEEDFTWAVMAINIQREVGGNLAEVLDILANTLRERDAVKRQIKSLTADGRISAMILMVLPFAVAAMVLLINPGYLSALFDTAVGVAMLLLALILLTVGGLWLRKIISIEV